VTKNLRIKIILVLVILMGSLYFIYPTFQVATMSSEERERLETEDPDKFDALMAKTIKRGLDLKGGMHLVLEVDDSQLKDDEKKDILDRALEIIRNRVDQFGVSEPIIQKQGARRIIVQLPGLQDAERAKRLIGQTAMLQWRLVRQQQEVAGILGRLDEHFKLEMGDSIVEILPGLQDTLLGEVPETPEADMVEGTALVDTSAPDSTLPVPGLDMDMDLPLQTVNKDKPFSSLFSSFYRDWLVVSEANVPRVNRMLAQPEVAEEIPEDSEFMWYDEWITTREGRVKFLFLLAKDVMISGANLVDASPRPDPQTPTQLVVNFRFNRTGARLFSRFTGENVGRFTAIVLDGKIKSYPVIKTKIPNGQGIIEGFTDEEARDVAIVLRAGALPAPMFIREERTVGPSLGADSIRMGVKASLFGLAVVLLFMLIYYRISGVIASLALILNLIVLFGLLAYLGAALTLPGIAGIILTIGMAIDANVLIFERIREELRKAKTVRSSIDAGYERAFTTILDANITTLITAVVLWQFGTGPIKGFATTLSIGIVVSMFTALVFSRVIFDIWTSGGRVTKLSI